eukprot:5394954-Pleurochrysis_carterae.AAC.1
MSLLLSRTQTLRQRPHTTVLPASLRGLSPLSASSVLTATQRRKIALAGSPLAGARGAVRGCGRRDQRHVDLSRR